MTRLAVAAGRDRVQHGVRIVVVDVPRHVDGGVEEVVAVKDDRPAVGTPPVLVGVVGVPDGVEGAGREEPGVRTTVGVVRRLPGVTRYGLHRVGHTGGVALEELFGDGVVSGADLRERPVVRDDVGDQLDRFSVDRRGLVA